MQTKLSRNKEKKNTKFRTVMISKEGGVQRREGRRVEGTGGEGEGTQRALTPSLWSPFTAFRVMVLSVSYVTILYTLHIFSKSSTVSVQYLTETMVSESAATIHKSGLRSPVERQR